MNRLYSAHARFNTTFGVALIAAATVCNPWVIGWISTRDGRIDDSLTWAVTGLASFALAIAGVRLVWRRHHIWLAEYLFVSLLGLIIFGASLLLDRALGLAGLPSENTIKYLYPPNAHFVRKSTDEFEVVVETNSQGFRSPEIPLRRENPDEARVLVLGDSFTEGDGVALEETFTARLEARVRRAARDLRFINAGREGSHPEFYLRTLLTRGFDYDLDGVLICLYANDVAETRAEADYVPGRRPVRHGLHGLLSTLYPRLYAQYGMFKYRRALPDDPRAYADLLVAKGRNSVSPARFEEWRQAVPEELMAASYRGELAIDILTMGLHNPDWWSGSLNLDTPKAQAKWQNIQKILTFMVEESRRRGLQVATVLIPTPFQYDARFFREDTAIRLSGIEVDEAWLTEETELQRSMRHWADAHQVPLLDLADTYREAMADGGPPLNHLIDSHWTVRGHRVAAVRIGSWLEAIHFVGNDTR